MSNRKARQKEKDRGERERLRLKKEKARLELEEREEFDAEREEAPPAETVEKSYDDPIPTAPGGGPTSFEELDELEDAMEKSEEVAEVSWAVQDLVRNILNDGELNPTEKADRIMDVADGFAERVNAMVLESDEVKKDMDLLELEALVGYEERHTTLLEKGGDLIKRVLTSRARKRLDDSDFALPSKRKYPIHDKAHVRNALSRAAQQIKSGGAGAADAKAALPKIRAAAKRMGIGNMEKSAILVQKDKSGDWRWIGKPSNNFIDSQGDIMCRSAHEKYVAWLEKNTDLYPAFVHWHTPGTARTNPVDFVMEHEGALIMSGKLTEDEAAALLKMQAKTEMGMSLQGFGLRQDTHDPRVITDYWLYEVSDLPLENAANPFTSLETIAKEAAGMDKLQYLTEMMGSEEKAKAFLERTGQMQKQLQEAGITSKEQEPPAAEVAPPEPQKAPELDVTMLTKQIVAAVGREFDMEGLSVAMAKVQESLEKVALLEGVVKELQEKKDDRLAEMLTPPVAKFSWTTTARPSASADNTLSKGTEEDKKLEKAGPGVPSDYWLSQLTGTVPVQE